MTVCKRVTYAGRVQGVGFRYTAQGLAARFSLAGYVRNLPDGRVELVVEGEADEVEAVLAAVGRRMGANIDQAVAEDAEPTGQRGFQIRH